MAPFSMYVNGLNLYICADFSTLGDATHVVNTFTKARNSTQERKQWMERITTAFEYSGETLVSYIVYLLIITIQILYQVVRFAYLFLFFALIHSIAHSVPQKSLSRLIPKIPII